MAMTWRHPAVVFVAALVLALLLVPTAGAYDRDMLRDAGPDELMEHVGKDGCVGQVLLIYNIRRNWEHITEDMELSGDEARQMLYGLAESDPDLAAQGVPGDLIGVHIADGVIEGKSTDELRNEVVDLCDEHLPPPEVHQR